MDQAGCRTIVSCLDKDPLAQPHSALPATLAGSDLTSQQVSQPFTATTRPSFYPRPSPQAAIVTSTSTPASMLMIICLTTSVGAFKSISLLWILISNISHVLLPSPQGVLRVVILRVLVGRRTGPLTRRFLDLARSRSSVQTFSRACGLREVSVMRILWIFCGEG